MPVTNVKTQWVDGNLNFLDVSGNIIATWDGTNRKLSLPSGSTFESLGTNTIADASLAAADIALTTGSIFVGSSNKAAALDMKADGAILIGNGTTAAAKTTSGDAKIANDGSITIQAKAVENTMIAAAAGTVLVGTKTSGDVTALDNSAEGAVVIGQGAGETCVAAALSGDVKMDKTGATTIQAKAVENTMIAAAAGTVLVGTKTSGDVTALDISAEGAMVLGQGAGETAAAYAMSGDVTMTKGGATSIGAGKVTNAMLANGAGVGALLTAGLGGSVSVTKTDAATTTIVAAHGTKDRACLVLVTVDETYDIGTGTLPTVKIGEDDTIEKCMAGTVLDTEAAGTVLAFAFTNTATKKIIVTSTAAVGDATGGCSITVLAIPTT